ncbi:MAG: ATP-binding cassette domain-containing protein [Sandaracinaceae bacterium]|nr:ATP-binding cassette domain-containing protein [Sandaracinaceae bacterium]
MPASPILRMEGVSKRFGAVVALDGVDLSVARGEVHALVGENGAGKSTLMKVLSGAVRPDAGTMSLAGAPYAPRGPRDALRLGVAMIYQELNLAPDLTVAQNLLLGREAHRFGVLSPRAQRAEVERILALLGSDELWPDRRVEELGPGPRQLTELGRALIGEARVVVLDEPTSSLSAAEVETLDAVVRRLRERGVSIVYISHFLEEVQRIADRYTVLRDGRTVGGGGGRRHAHRGHHRGHGGARARRGVPARAPRAGGGRAGARRPRWRAPARPREPRAPARRDPGPRGPGRGRAHRARARALRPRAREERPRGRARRARSRPPRTGAHRAGVRPPERGPQGRRPRARPQHRGEPHALERARLPRGSV